MGARKLWDRNWGAESRIAECGVGSESMGETRPGERIRRGSIRPTMGNPDLELCGEFGTERVCFDRVSDLDLGLEMYLEGG